MDGPVGAGIAVRLAGPEDCAALAAMIDAMNAYYGDPETRPGATVAACARWLAGGTAARFALAFDGAIPVGFAGFTATGPGDDHAGLLYLKDLFVAEGRQGERVGERLMRFLARHCVRNGLGGIDWIVETERSERFYGRLGARAMPRKSAMRLDGPSLAALAALPEG